MIQGFYTAKTALTFRQMGMDVISNNFANINTEGYKKDEAIFEDALYNLSRKQYPGGDRTYYTTGSGTFISSIGKDFSQGSLKETGGTLDLALNGPGFIGVKDDIDNLFYTRGGSFKFTPSDEEGFKNIINDQGYFLVDSNEEKIKVSAESNDINIETDGEVIFDMMEPVEEGEEIRLLVVNFNNPAMLLDYGEGRFGRSDLSGAPYITERASVLQGYKEMSNVDLAEEMTDLILHQRIFQLNSKIVQTADELESVSNNLRK